MVAGGSLIFNAVRPEPVEGVMCRGRSETALDHSKNKSTPPGVARQLVTFLVLPRKVTQRRRPRFAALRVPCVARLVRRAAELALRAQTVLAEPPDQPALLAALRG